MPETYDDTLDTLDDPIEPIVIPAAHELPPGMGPRLAIFLGAFEDTDTLAEAFAEFEGAGVPTLTGVPTVAELAAYLGEEVGSVEKCAAILAELDADWDRFLTASGVAIATPIGALAWPAAGGKGHA